MESFLHVFSDQDSGVLAQRSFLLVLVGCMWLLAPGRLVELFERFDRLVRTRDELLPLGADSDAGAGFGRALPGVPTDGAGVLTVWPTACQRCIGDVHVALAVGRAFLGHGLAARVCERLGLLELGLGGSGGACPDGGLRLH